MWWPAVPRRTTAARLATSDTRSRVLCPADEQRTSNCGVADAIMKSAACSPAWTGRFSPCSTAICLNRARKALTENSPAVAREAGRSTWARSTTSRRYLGGMRNRRNRRHRHRIPLDRLPPASPKTAGWDRGIVVTRLSRSRCVSMPGRSGSAARSRPDRRGTPGSRRARCRSSRSGRSRWDARWSATAGA